MTIRLDVDALKGLEDLAQATDRSKAWLAAQALRSYLDVNQWQISAIRDALKRAGQKEARWLGHEEVDAWLASWGAPQERKPPR